MGGYDDCTRVQLSCIQDLANMKYLPQQHQSKSFDEVEAMLYQRLIERVNQMTLNVSKPSGKLHRMPDNLRAIVETAWTACTQDHSGDLIGSAESLISPVSDLSYGQSFYPTGDITSNDRKSDPSHERITKPKITFQPPVYPRNYASSEPRLLLKPDTLSILQSDSNDLDFSNYHNYQTEKKRKMRPLLRQRESFTIFADSRSIHGDSTSTVPLRNTMVTTPKPMQVHRRQTIPRKQDAIYNARYKTQPCLHYQKYRRCPLGDNCHFAHGPDELLHPQMHPKYRTRVCLNYAQTGTCPFGKQCYFLHYIPCPNVPQIPKDSSTRLMAPCSNTSLWMDNRHAVCGT
ncbi:Zinc finger protein 36 C3H1 type 1 [Fasciolopsis buskii]|uniref:Zinc finger protein 36 C3H1 type 1 n=1 Tax=Fasciolopsis buskii TaxID=27845 RepID=A0A8E0RQ79_9TREM|nr:Zinc finger protein 36 C3H1 type 1 [Fasciolopsis buski]